MFLSLELSKGIITDRVLHFAGFGFDGVGINTSISKSFRKILMSHIELFCNLST
ncbi:hypothetical protein HMPREF1316_0111 [Olsenella profusa F0195]|uniref:Uncharacterized protein n=1 Tax=Olsenella profusa F0195 TaxID=1125712 RepID=U2TQA9_9ACTN|nr:hypothetical protein HMPREF1316_0111 [Olsenella profusa F0195]